MELAILTEAVKVFLPGLAVVAGAFVLITFILMILGKGIGRSLRGGLQIGAVPMLAPLMMLAMAAGFGRPQQVLYRDGATTTGKVVENRRYTNDGTSFSAIVSFEAPGGRTVTIEEMNSSNPPRYSVGQDVKVVYMPDEPDIAVIHDGLWWLIPVILAAGALLSWIVTTVVMTISYRRRTA